MSSHIAKSKKTLVTIYIRGWSLHQRFRFYVNNEQEKNNLTELILAPNGELRNMAVDIILGYKYWDEKCKKRFKWMIGLYLRDFDKPSDLNWYNNTRVNENYSLDEHNGKLNHWLHLWRKKLPGTDHVIHCLPPPYIFIL